MADDRRLGIWGGSNCLGMTRGENSGDGTPGNPFVVPILESTWRQSNFTEGDRITLGRGQDLLLVTAVDIDKKTIFCMGSCPTLFLKDAVVNLYVHSHEGEVPMSKVLKDPDPNVNMLMLDDLYKQVSANLNKERIESQAKEKAKKVKEEPKAIKTPNIEAFCKNLSEMARRGMIDPVIGRKKEIQRITQILGRRRKNNPVILGEAGTGKSALVEGLALSIAKEESCCRKLHGVILISLDLTLLVSGTTLRGQFEERISGLIKELELFDDLIVFIDEIHTIVSCGASEGAADAANILKPALARGRIQVIGATTLSEYKIIKGDAALARRFQPVVLEDLSKDEIMQILRGVKPLYEKHHEVKYTNKALDRILELSEGIVGRFAPDIQIDLMDEAGAASTRRKVDAEDVDKVYELQYASNQNKDRTVGFGV